MQYKYRIKIAKHLIIGVWFSCFITSCANIVAPTGGPKDEEPPNLVQSLSVPNPTNNTNMQGDYISLFFDEPTNTDALLSNITSTPEIDTKTIKIKTSSKRIQTDTGRSIKGTRVLIDLNQNLDSNTTYVINFGQGFKDYGEGKIAENISIAFSTGPIIDSMQIGGTIIDNNTGKPASGFLVGLYPQHDTINATKDKPRYFTSSAKDGKFIFNYLKRGFYNIVAFEDKNSNKTFEPTERVAFLSETINLDSNYLDQELIAFFENRIPLQLLYVESDQKSITLNFSKGLDSLAIAHYKNDLNVLSADRKQVKLYKPAIGSDSISLFATDSVGQTLDTTIYATYDSLKIPVKKGTKHTDYQLFKSNYTETLSFYDPIYENNLHLSTVYAQDSLLTFDSICTVTTNTNKTTIQVNCRLPFSPDTLSFAYDTVTFVSITEDSISIKNKSITQEQTDAKGSLYFEVISDYKNYIVYITNKKGQVIEQYKNPQKIELVEKDPQNIYVRVLIDSNNNDKYDTGHYLEGKQPEKIIYIKEGYKIKAGWDITDLIIDLTQTEFEKQ